MNELRQKQFFVGEGLSGALAIGGKQPFALIAGPCQIENRDHAMMMAEKLVKHCEEKGRGLIFKASYDKANRSSLGGQRGIGMESGLKILSEIRTQFSVPVISDIHDAAQAKSVAEVVDILQIPAFLSRQTDLLLAAGKTGAAINVKKGQFLAPWDMANVVSKIESTGNERIMLCERGTSFGYNTLVSDFRALPIMAKTGCPIVFDATHSVQSPGGQGTSTGGDRSMVPPLARAAVAVGVDALFIETHQDPDNAPSDGPNMVPLEQIPILIDQLARIEAATGR